MSDETMGCERIGELLVDSWNEALDPAGRRALDDHLEGCESCREEAERLGAVWRQLGEADAPVPSDRLRARFYAALAERQAREAGSPWRRLAALWPERRELQMAVAAAALAVGVGLGALVAGASGPDAEIEALQVEMAAMSRTVGLALLDHPSASERLRGVAWSARGTADDRTLDALVEAATRDPNVNVRLAAVEALSARAERPEVRARLLDTLPEQRSPLLQAAVLDLLLSTDPDASGELRRRLDLDSLDPAVREALPNGDPV